MLISRITKPSRHLQLEIAFVFDCHREVDEYTLFSTKRSDREVIQIVKHFPLIVFGTLCDELDHLTPKQVQNKQFH